MAAPTSLASNTHASNRGLRGGSLHTANFKATGKCNSRHLLEESDTEDIAIPSSEKTEQAQLVSLHTEVKSALEALQIAIQQSALTTEQRLALATVMSAGKTAR
jgi:hypothetical protein